MAGATLDLEIDDLALLDTFTRLQQRGQDLAPVWQEFGDHMRGVDQFRFERSPRARG